MRYPLLVLALVSWSLVTGSDATVATAGPKASRTAPAVKSAKSTTKSASKGSKKKRRVAVFQGHNAAKSALRQDPLERPSGNVWLRAENLGEEVKVNIYKKDGTYDDAALAKLDEMFRCIRTGEVRAVKAELYEQMSRIFDHFEGKQIQLVSGHRFAERDSSRHFHASAMDIRVKDVAWREVYKYAETLDMGHMGIGQYPRSQFVHVDFRAPGEPSFRWTDWSGHSSGKKKATKKKTSRSQPARKPVS